MSESWPDENEQEWQRHPPEVIARVLAAPPTWLDRLAPRVIGLAIGAPWMIFFAFMALPPLIERLLPPGPVMAVLIEGYHLNYRPTLHSCGRRPCLGSVDYYMGLAADGHCHTALYPNDWDPGMCAIRLRQIEANDCRAVPVNDDSFCHQMLADLAAPGATKQRVRVTLFMQRGKVVDWKPAP